MAQAPHILIAGRPRSGKTTLALDLGHRLGVPVRSTDDLVGKNEWSNVSEIASHWLDNPEPWIIEGVAAVRALRKWLARHPKPEDGLPFSEMYWRRVPRVPALSPGQATMGKACESIWKEIRDDVLARAMVARPSILLNEEASR